jgi:hypothetical protein
MKFVLAYCEVLGKIAVTGMQIAVTEPDRKFRMQTQAIGKHLSLFRMQTQAIGKHLSLFRTSCQQET